MNSTAPDRLDQALDDLAREIAPPRDLWPDIQASLEPDVPRARRPRVWRSPRVMGLAAAVLLVVASSTTTYIVMRGSAQDAVDTLAGAALRTNPLQIQSASFGSQQLGAGYQHARAPLIARFNTQLAAMPPVARAKLERDLEELQRAASEVSATLREYPSDPLLQELLLSAYQSELQLLGDISDMTTNMQPLSVTRTNL